MASERRPDFRGSPIGTKRFSLVYVNVMAETGHGEEVRIFGPSSVLGGDNPEHGVRLVTTPSLYPLHYTSAPLSLPLGKPVEIKVCVYAGGAISRMEQHDNAVRTVVPRSDSLTVQILFGVAENSTLMQTNEPVASPTSEAPPADLLQVSTTRRERVTESAPLRQSLRLSTGGGTPMAGDETPPPPMEDADGLRLPPELAWQRSARRLSQNTARLRASGHELAATEKRARTMEGESRLTSSDGLIVVLRFLPVVLGRDEAGRWTAEWDQEDPLVLQSAQRLRVTYVGGVRWGEAIEPGAEEEGLVRALRRLNCVPVLLPRTLQKQFDGFSDKTLWPVFHNVTDVYGGKPTRWWNRERHKGQYQAYTNANRLFCDKVVEVWNEKDLIWAHDYQLLLLPSFLSRRLPASTVGLFLHIPFPPSELFRSLSMRDHLLQSMLNADLIGFNLFEYARHFLTSCRRLLGLAYEALPGGTVGIDNNGRTVVVTANHMGMEPSLPARLLQEESVQSQAEALTQRFAGRRIIVGVDPIERVNALPLKLASVFAFLEAHPEWRGAVVFLQYGVVGKACECRQKCTCDQMNRAIINAEVRRINDAFSGADGTPAIVYEERTEVVRVHERMVLWLAADVFVHSPARDARSLQPFEFVLAQATRAARPGEAELVPGALVLSEFSSGARVLSHSLHANPFFEREMAEAICAALTMSDDDRRERNEGDYQVVQSHTTLSWAQNVVLDLKRCAKESSVKFQGVGFGLGFRLLGMDTHFSKLPMEEVRRAYRRSSRRAFFLDYGGTLVPETGSFGTTPKLPKSIGAALTRLAEDPRNTVFVLSGQTVEVLSTAFAGVRGVGLAAEHGFYVHVSGDDDDDGRLRFEPRCAVDSSWRDVAESIMECYSERTNGTYVDKNGSSLVWRFQDADPEYGSMQAAELHDHLTGVLRNFPIQVLRGSGYVEIRPRDINKGTTVDHIMAMLECDGHSVDFIFAVGDDAADEYMFSHAAAATVASAGCVFTCTVGLKPSGAKYYLRSDEDVVELVASLGSLSAAAANRNLSMTDLSSVAKKQASGLVASASLAHMATPRRHGRSTSSSVQAFMQSSDEEEEDGIFF